MFGFNFNFNGMNFGFGNQGQRMDPRMMMLMGQLQPIAQQIASVMDIVGENPEQASEESIDRYNDKFTRMRNL